MTEPAWLGSLRTSTCAGAPTRGGSPGASPASRGMAGPFPVPPPPLTVTDMRRLPFHPTGPSKRPASPYGGCSRTSGCSVDDSGHSRAVRFRCEGSRKIGTRPDGVGTGDVLTIRKRAERADQIAERAFARQIPGCRSSNFRSQKRENALRNRSSECCSLASTIWPLSPVIWLLVRLQHVDIRDRAFVPKSLPR
jgi:hypothetical protein